MTIVQSKWWGESRWNVGLSVQLTLAAFISFCRMAGAAPSAEETSQHFESRIRPLLVARCLSCHGEDKQESELRLDSRAAILAGGQRGMPAAMGGQPAKSLLLQAVRYDTELQMPPDGKLTDEQIADLERWIMEGLPWPAGAAAPLAAETMSDRIARQRAEHWAFQPIAPPDVPTDVEGGWCRNPIDNYILDRLRKHRLSPSPPADRYSLLRRLSFDLLGLPPTAAEVEQFIADRSPNAYANLVERLLASPHYGERWGRHWLDVARYADTSGYAFERDRRYPHAYTYRDYVVRSLNADLSFDRFVVEQLAADQLDLGDDNRPLAALGFLTAGRKFNNRHDDIDDQIDVVTRGLLGVTVACARCHDHKYDAITTEDYYGLYGVFANSHEPAERPVIGRADVVVRYTKRLERLAQHQRELDDFTQRLHDRLLDTARQQATDYLQAILSEDSEEVAGSAAAPTHDRNELAAVNSKRVVPKLVQRWREFLREHANATHPVWMPWHSLTQLPDDDVSSAAAKMLEALNSRSLVQINPLVRAAIARQPPANKADVARIYGELLAETYRMWRESGANDQALRNMPDDRRQLAIQLFDRHTPTAIDRGMLEEYLPPSDQHTFQTLRQQVERVRASELPEVIPRAMVLHDRDTIEDAHVLERGNPQRLGPRVPRRFPALLATAAVGHSPFTSGSGRLNLAQAIVDRHNPLTARVIVNRIWMHHMGRPLVDSPSDFGIRSPEPRHRALLDYLAWRLMDVNWSWKALHREIVMSATYRQSSLDRPESLRIDPENHWLWRMERRRLEFEALRDALLQVTGALDRRMGGPAREIFRPPSTHGETFCRTIYGIIDRQDLPNLLRVFDFASPDQSSPRRGETIVPQQALFLMNGPFVAGRARDLADQWNHVTEAGDYIRQLYRQVFAREPLEAEMIASLDLLQGNSTRNGNAPPRWQLAQILLMANEFLFVD